MECLPGMPITGRIDKRGRLLHMAFDRTHTRRPDDSPSIFFRKLGRQGDCDGNVLRQVGLVIPVVDHFKGDALGGQVSFATEDGDLVAGTRCQRCQKQVEGRRGAVRTVVRHGLVDGNLEIAETGIDQKSTGGLDVNFHIFKAFFK